MMIYFYRGMGLYTKGFVCFTHLTMNTWSLLFVLLLRVIGARCARIFQSADGLPSSADFVVAGGKCHRVVKEIYVVECIYF
jgi:hypothetical protein